MSDSTGRWPGGPPPPASPPHPYPGPPAYGPSLGVPGPPPAPYGYGFAPPPPPRRRGVGVVVALVVVVVVLVLGAVVAAVVLPVALSQRTALAPCGTETAPSGAGADAIAYVEAVNRTTPARQELSDTIADAGMRMSTDDLVTAVELDDLFLADLRAITFAPASQPAARRMVVAVEDYQAFVQRAIDEPGYLDAHRDEDAAVNRERAAAGEELRTALGLAQSGCVFNRP